MAGRAVRRPLKPTRTRRRPVLPRGRYRTRARPPASVRTCACRFGFVPPREESAPARDAGHAEPHPGRAPQPHPAWADPDSDSPADPRR